MKLKDYYYYYYYKIYFFLLYLKKFLDNDTLLFLKGIKISLYIGYSIIIIDLTCELIWFLIK